MTSEEKQAWEILDALEVLEEKLDKAQKMSGQWHVSKLVRDGLEEQAKEVRVRDRVKTTLVRALQDCLCEYICPSEVEDDDDDDDDEGEA